MSWQGHLLPLKAGLQAPGHPVPKDSPIKLKDMYEVQNVWNMKHTELIFGAVLLNLQNTSYLDVDWFEKFIRFIVKRD